MWSVRVLTEGDTAQNSRTQLDTAQKGFKGRAQSSHKLARAPLPVLALDGSRMDRGASWVTAVTLSKSGFFTALLGALQREEGRPVSGHARCEI